MDPTDEGEPLAGARERRPRIVALMGLPGAGKSMVARMLEREFDLRVVSRDAIRAAMFPRCDHSFAEKQAALHGVMLAVEINGLLGASSVIDGVTFSRLEDRRRVLELARRHAFDLFMLMLDCPVDVARDRVRVDREQRAHPAADRTCDLVDAVAARFAPPPADALRVDASLPPEDVIRLAREAFTAAIASRPDAIGP
ncbi:MAG: hypothetical protein EOP90_11860 [Lysobacteraceae bacterium]|nr:MAG: hypothetical protein EOP90_11860 [Xanthomonadaceae bacterium]